MRHKRHGKTQVGKKILLSCNIAAMLCLLLSYLSSYIDPQFFWPLAFFGIGYLPILIVNILFIIIWSVKRSAYLILSLLCILIGYNTLQRHFGLNSSDNDKLISRKDTAEIRICSYNVHLFRAADNLPKPVNREQIIQLINDISPDIVCLQEFYTRKKGTLNIQKTIAESLGLPYTYFHPVIQNEFEAYGLMILSKFPIQRSGVIQSPGNTASLNRMIYADIIRNGRSFRVYNIHLKSIGFTPEDYAYIKNIPGKSFDNDVEASKRIGSKLKNAFRQRSAQALYLKTELDRCAKPFIVAGDFNDTPSSFVVHSIAEDLNNSFEEKGKGWGVTYNGDFPNFQIDYILSTKDFSVQSYQIEKIKLSDHYPIWTDLKLEM